jgi:Kef-type K+ transport system membrane component KefB/mannitol/fructose-specific phosphotransferase system IIA component (Ntr-type)
VLERGSAITIFASVGLVYIMFLAGLEIDLHQFLATRNRSLLFGVTTFLIPQGLGALAGRYVLGLDWRASVLLASMFASHTLLAYPIASRLGIARCEPVTVTVSATIVTDTLALLVLAVIADAARGMQLGFGFWVGIGVGMTVLLLLIWFGIPWLTRWFFHRVTEGGGAQFLFVLATVCVCAYLSHFARMEPIIGAFLAGAAFNRLVPEQSTLMNRVSFVGNNLFIPFFLVSVGMLVDPRAFLSSPQTWLVAGTMVAAVTGTKFGAAWLAARWFGYDRDSRQVMFGLSVVQAAATLAAVLVGFELEIFGEAVLNGTIMMIAVTCPLGAWLVDRHGRRLAQTVAREEPAPSPGRRLLAAVSNPGTATALLDLVLLLHRPKGLGSVHALTVVQDEGNTERAVARGEHLMGLSLTQAAAAAVPLQPMVRVDSNPADGIVRAAKELRATTVLAGWSGDQAFGARFFGTVSSHLLTACSARLLFCHLPQPLATCNRFLLLWPPLADQRSDFDPLLDDIQQLAGQLGLEIRVFAVGDQDRALQHRLDTMSPPRPWSVVTAGSLGEAQNHLLDEVGAEDLILLPCERRGASLWTPAFDRLPNRVAARFPNNSLLVAYPNTSTGWEPTTTQSLGEETTPGSKVRAMVFGVEVGLDEALRSLAGAAFPDVPTYAEQAYRLLAESTRQYPVELGNGMVLVHGHCEVASEPVVMAARTRGAWSLPETTAPFVLVIGLITPKALAPEQHLQLLKSLAMGLQDPEAAARLADAVAPDEIEQLLADAVART